MGAVAAIALFLGASSQSPARSSPARRVSNDSFPNLLLLSERTPDNWVVVEVARGQRTQTTFSVSQVALSPDGSHVALRWPNWGGIDVGSIDGSQKRTVLEADGSHYVSSFDWAPNGKQLTYALSTRTAPETGGIYVVGRDGHGRHLIADLPATEVRWSPDGSLIAFVVNRAGNGPLDGVYVMRPDGSEQRRVEAGTGRLVTGPRISWSSDARSILSVHAQGEVASAAFVIGVRTGRKAFIPRVGAGVFAPRGRRVLIGRGYHLYFARLLTGPPAHPTIVVATGATTPAWASDGRRIAYTTTNGLWVFNVTTGERHRVLAWALRPVEAKFGLVWATH
jgi:Tol biopolymer transport system component